MIIQTSAGKHYIVDETGRADLAHVWNGYPVKVVSGGVFALSAEGKRLFERQRPELVRKIGCVVVSMQERLP